jgi:signal transduction histidine kinase
MINPLTRPPDQSDSHRMMTMLAWIAIIHFAIEALIMGALSKFHFTREVVLEGLLDSTLLTLMSTPLIYFWVAKPFVIAARDAEAAVAHELKIQHQQSVELQKTLGILSTSLDQNEDLRLKLQRANQETADVNERTLQKIAAELHDGPAQLLTYSLLRLGKFAPIIEAVDGVMGKAELEYMRVALTDTLSDLRNISRGLSLPHLEDATLEEAIGLAVALHREQTGTPVQLVVSGLPAALGQGIKVCVYRIIQESLSNAYRHGRASGQKVSCCCTNQLVLEISDQGPGFEFRSAQSDGLGLLGMRSRIEALGGTLDIRTAPGCGTTLTFTIDLGPLSKREAAHGQEN